MADNIQFLTIKKGTTSKRLPIFIKDPAVTTGAGKSGLVFNTATLKFYYWRENTGNAAGVSVTLQTATRGTWASGGFIEIDATNLPGWYEIGLPDAALATGANWVLLELWNATGAPVNLFVQLVDYDLQDSVRLGLTALPNAVPGAAGLILSGAAANQLDIDASGRVNLGKWLGAAPNALVASRVDASMGAIVAGQVVFKKNVAFANFMFQMLLADHYTPATGIVVTATRAIDGGAFGACTNSGTIAEIASGWYSINLSAADLNGANIALHFTGAGCDAANFLIVTQP